jgi:hypothetical protein
MTEVAIDRSNIGRWRESGKGPILLLGWAERGGGAAMIVAEARLPFPHPPNANSRLQHTRCAQGGGESGSTESQGRAAACSYFRDILL